jgi:hypothetical protein
MTNQSTPVVLKDRLFAFFDVLGFSEQLRKKDPVELHATYSAFIDEANNTIFFPENMVEPVGRQQNFEIARFAFDSVILVSQAGGRAAHNFVFGALQLMSNAFRANLPMRGAIGFGDFLDDAGRGIFMARHWPELVRLEKEQQWSGCVVHASAEKTIFDSVFGNMPGIPLKQSSQVLPYGVPWKSLEPSEKATCLCINWCALISSKDAEIGMNYLNSEKRPGTEAFLSFYRSLEPDEIYLQPEFAPATKARTLKSRHGMILRFENDAGDPTEPGCKTWR